MSLQVWLPLVGSLENKGLNPVSITNNGATVNNSGKIGKCYSFDGTDDRIYSNFSIGNEWSAGCWFYAATSTRAWSALILLNHNSGDADTQIGLYCNPSTGKISSIANGVSHVNTVDFLDKWTHYVTTFKNQILSTYINGELVATKTITNTALTKTHLTIGARSTNANGAGTSAAGYFQGQLNDVRIYDHALSLREIREISKALALHYPLNNNGLGNPNPNLLNNNFTKMSTWIDHGLNSATVTTEGYRNTYTLIKGIGGWESFYSSSTITLEPGTYTFSCQYKTYSNFTQYSGSFGLRLTTSPPTSNDNSTTIATLGFSTSANDLTRISTTFTLTESKSVYIGINGGHITDGLENKVFDINYIKLEIGSKVTSWCPNQTDNEYAMFGYNNTIVYDLSGYQHNGTLKDITYSTDSPKYYISSQFDATKTSYIKVNQNNWMAQGATDMTINLWAYMNDWSTWNGNRLFSCTESGGWNIQATVANSLTFPVMVYTNANKTSTGYIPSVDRVSILKTDISSGWHMFTYIYNISGCKVYLDAQLYQEKTYASYGIHYALGSSKLYLGCEANGTASTGPYFTGKQSDFRIYYTTLSEADILKLYQKPVLADRNNNFYTYGNFNQIDNNTISIEREAIVNINELHEIVRNNLLSNTSIEKSGNSANAQWFRWDITNPYLTINTPYTLSFDAKITNASDVFYISFGNADSTQQVIQQGTIVTTTYRRYTIVCQTTKTNINSIIMSNAKQYNRGNENNTGSTLYVKNIKLEFGDYSTPYTQAGNNISNIYYTRDGLFINNQSLEI